MILASTTPNPIVASLHLHRNIPHYAPTHHGSTSPIPGIRRHSKRTQISGNLEVTPWRTFDEPAHAGRGKSRQWRHPLRTIGGHGLWMATIFAVSTAAVWLPVIIGAPDGVLGTASPGQIFTVRAHVVSVGRRSLTPRARLGPRGHTPAEACSMLTGGTPVGLSLACSQERGLSPTHSSVAPAGVPFMALASDRIITAPNPANHRPVLATPRSASGSPSKNP